MMLRSMLTASTALNQLQQQMDTVSDNLSNSDTTGYKARDSRFSELIRQQYDHIDDKKENSPNMRKTPPGLRLGAGTVMTPQLDSGQGSIKKTDRDLDIAFTSPYQYLQAEADGRRVYTRDGSLSLKPAGGNDRLLQLMTAGGNPILDENGQPIQIDSSLTQLKISKTGTLTASDQAGTRSQTFNLGIVNVNNPQALHAEGDNLFSVNGAGASAIEELTGANRQAIGMEQGALEGSNVDMSKEMTDLIVSQRSYQLNSRTITLGDQMLGLINSVR